MGWYEARWGIEDRQLHEAEALQQCLAFDAVTAWRVFSLDRYARDEPETLAAEVLTEGEREVIGIVVRAERLLLPSERDRPFQPGHPQLGHPDGPHGGLASVEPAATSRERGALARLRANAGHGVILTGQARSVTTPVSGVTKRWAGSAW